MKARELAFAVCAGLLVAGAAAAQEAKPGEKPMSAEQKAMMDAWQKFATPWRGPQGAGRAWSAPGTPR